MLGAWAPLALLTDSLAQQGLITTEACPAVCAISGEGYEGLPSAAALCTSNGCESRPRQVHLKGPKHSPEVIVRGCSAPYTCGMGTAWHSGSSAHGQRCIIGAACAMVHALLIRASPATVDLPHMAKDASPVLPVGSITPCWHEHCRPR